MYEEKQEKIMSTVNDLLGSNLVKVFKDTYREKASSNQTPTLSKSMNVDAWVVDSWNQLFIRSS